MANSTITLAVRSSFGRPLNRLVATLALVSATLGFSACAPADAAREANSASLVEAVDTLNTVAAATDPASTAAKDRIAARRNTGHYISLNRKDTLDVLRELKQQPGIRGFQRRHYWRALEPSPGEYDFAPIIADLEAAARHGLQYVVFVEDKTFNGDIPTPDFLARPPQTLKNRNRGYTAARWRPEVADPFRALIVAIGQAFDEHPNFEGIAVQESALSLSDAALREAGYQPAAYQRALTNLLTAGSAALTSGNLFWHMNFLQARQRGLADIIEKTVLPARNIIVGGPDVLPERQALKRHTYPLYRQFRGQVTFFNSMQFDSFAHKHSARGPGSAKRYWTLVELTEFARDELGVSYLFWNRKTWRKPAGSYAIEDAYPVFARYAQLSPPADNCFEQPCTTVPAATPPRRSVTD